LALSGEERDDVDGNDNDDDGNSNGSGGGFDSAFNVQRGVVVFMPAGGTGAEGPRRNRGTRRYYGGVPQSVLLLSLCRWPPCR